MGKKLLAAGIVRDIEFSSKEHLELYVYDLTKKGCNFQILDQCVFPDKRCVIRIVSQYNNSDLIPL